MLSKTEKGNQRIFLMKKKWKLIKVAMNEKAGRHYKTAGSFLDFNPLRNKSFLYSIVKTTLV